MNSMNSILEQAANICAVCHDQCVSACPVFESSRQMAAYPSRLAMMALELNKGGLPPNTSLAQGMNNCIGCNACLEACLYIDHPNDITPVVRWARQSLNRAGLAGDWVKELVEEVDESGTPYGDMIPALIQAQATLPKLNSLNAEKVLLYADAATLFYAPEIVASTVHLLQTLGVKNIHLAQQVYPGGELWQYGCIQEFERAAQKVAKEISIVKPAKIIAISPYCTYLLREIYPAELGLQLNAPVLMLAETIADLIEASPRQRLKPAYLILSSTEAYQIGAGAALRVMEKLGIPVIGFREDLKYRWMSFPEGKVIGLEQDPKTVIQRRIVTAIEQSGVNEIVVTNAEALASLHSFFPEAQVVDLASFCSDFIKVG